MKQIYIHMMANRSQRPTLYVGVTNDLPRRVWEHKHMLVDGFTQRYLIDRLVYYEPAPDAPAAITREKQIKGWLRAKKIVLIESVNPGWRDLSLDFLDIRPTVSPHVVKEQERNRRDSSLSEANAGVRSNTHEQSKLDDRQGAQNDDGGRP
jgi:putative endonuclease